MPASINRGIDELEKLSGNLSDRIPANAEIFFLAGKEKFLHIFPHTGNKCELI